MARGSSTEPTILSQDFWFGYDTALTKLISVCGVWHDGTLLRPTIFHLVCLKPDQSCARISRQGNCTLVHHLDPPYSVWLVWLCWTSQKHLSLSVALWHAVHDWDPPSAACFGWIHWTSALLLKWVMLSQLVTLQLKGSGIHLISDKSIYFFPQRSHQQTPLSTF